MVAVIQRVKRAQVSVSDKIISQIGQGLLVLVGAHKSDTETDAAYLAKKIPELRIFSDPAGKMNLSLKDIQGELLLVSQFTLCADIYSGRRPSFTEAASPDLAIKLIDQLISSFKAQQIKVQTGEFAASMQVELVNDGPVTFVLDSSTQRK
ncbi:MAG: D-aminoacyl-tRNA deacylase [bacterium]